MAERGRQKGVTREINPRKLRDPSIDQTITSGCFPLILTTAALLCSIQRCIQAHRGLQPVQCSGCKRETPAGHLPSHLPMPAYSKQSAFPLVFPAGHKAKVTVIQTLGQAVTPHAAYPAGGGISWPLTTPMWQSPLESRESGGVLVDTDPTALPSIARLQAEAVMTCLTVLHWSFSGWQSQGLQR